MYDPLLELLQGKPSCAHGYKSLLYGKRGKWVYFIKTYGIRYSTYSPQNPYHADFKVAKRS